MKKITCQQCGKDIGGVNVKHVLFNLKRHLEFKHKGELHPARKAGDASKK